jgi:glyoxylase-like metal-dependent hydrolase (beta-lactamase superfamily II)
VIRPRSILPGVALFPVRTPTLPPATHTNSYALGDREVLLVEPATPFDDERRAWIEWAQGLEAQGRSIVGVLATHHHDDHVGGAGFLGRALGRPVFAHPLTWPRLRDRDGLDWRSLDDGASIVLEGPRPTKWSALHTPGHAPGHVCLYDAESGTLIAGDMVANGSTIVIPPDDGGDMAVYLDQLRRLATLGARTMLPAHGEPIDDPAAILSYYIAHRLTREAKVLAQYRALEAILGRPPTVAELLPRAYDDVSLLVLPLAKMSLVAHLEKLRREGVIAS